MTIEYKDSKRIVALSNDILDTVDYENTSAVSLGTGDSGTSIDLTGSTLDDSWTLRFKVTMTSLGTGSSLTFMVQNSTTTTVSTARDGIGLRQTDSSNFYDFEGCNNVAGNAGQYDYRFTTTPATDTKYVQIKRISTTSAKIEFYDSTYTTVSESSGNIEIANITGLRYFVISNNGSALTVDDIDFWNGTVTNKPTNVQDNSLLVEKDTARRYWFSEATAQTFEENFDGTTDSGWSFNDATAVSINTTTDKLEIRFPFDNTLNSTVYDLGAGIISDSAWVLRWEISHTTLTDPTGGSNFFLVGLFSEDETVDLKGTEDHLTAQFITRETNQFRWSTECSDDGTRTSGTEDTTKMLTSTDYYCELIRNGANLSYTVKTGSYSGTTVVDVPTLTIPSSVTGLRYLGVKNEIESDPTAVLDSDISNITFYNGVTSVTPATWTMPKLEDDFSTDNFSQTGTEIDVSGGELVWDAQPDGTTTGGYIDFGENLSDTAWVCRFKVQVNNYSGAVTTATNFFIQLQSITTVDSTTSRDSMGIHLRLKSGNTDWRVEAVDGSMAGGGAGNLIDGSATTETIYVQMYRDGNTIYAEWYDNANYTGTPTNTANHSSGTPVNLRYFAVFRRSDTTTTAVSNGIIDDLKIYNGVTSIN